MPVDATVSERATWPSTIGQRHGLWPWLAPALALAAALAIWMHFLSHKYYFFSDGFLNLMIAREQGGKTAYLTRDVFGQFIPLYRVVIAAYRHWFGLLFWPWLVMAFGITLGIMALLTRQAIARRVSPLLLMPALASIAFSPALGNCYEWFSAGLEVLPACVCGMGALLLAQDVRGRWPARRQAGALALFVAGLLFYPKMATLPVLVATVRLHERLERSERVEFLQAARGTVLDIWPLLAALVPYGAVIVLGRYASGAAQPGAGQLASFIGVALAYGFTAGTLGMAPGWPQFPFAANVLALALLAFSVARRRRAALLWAGFAVYFVLTMGLVGYNRAVAFGIASALTPRYVADPLCYAAVLALIAHRGTARVGRAWPLAIAALATSAFSAHLMAAELRAPPAWYAGTARVHDYVRALRRDLAALSPGTTIANAVLPEDVVPSWMAPMNRMQYFVRLFPGRHPVAPLACANAVVDGAGHISVLRHSTCPPS